MSEACFEGMDNTNAIVKLCSAGMEAEGRGDSKGALELFTLAWDQSGNPWESCIAAHYLARHQPSLQGTLEWNLKALSLAREVTDGSAIGFLPSLQLNVGHSYEMLGDYHEARRQYDQAADAATGLSEDGYGRFIRMGIEAGKRRIEENLYGIGEKKQQ